VTGSPRTLLLDRMPSPLGEMLLGCDGESQLIALDFADHEARMQRLLQRHHGTGRFTLTAGRAPLAVTAALAAFFAGELDAIASVAVRTAGTEFQRRVWVALRRIPAGATMTYGQLATVIGRPNACRAVGLANGANPVGIVVPCHRVIGADGTLTGYGGGIERKRWLLAHERRWAGERRASA
jgi:methylated-DNA-[protein]-cysteine S-methyltransferase